MHRNIETLFIFGLTLIFCGICCIYWPAALIFAGISLTVISYKLAAVSPIEPTPMIEKQADK